MAAASKSTDSAPRERSLRAVPWDLFEEHLDEAGWLWTGWEAAMDSAVDALADVAAGPEARLRAHLDGLVLGGAPAADRLLDPALRGDDPGVVAAAAWALLESEAEPAARRRDYQDQVIAALSSAPAPAARAAIGRAMTLSARMDLDRLLPSWESGDPAARARILGVLAARDPARARQWASAALRGGDALEMAAGLGALRGAPDPALLDDVARALSHEDRAVQDAAMIAGVRLGVRQAWDACRRAALTGGDGCRVPLGLLATSADANDRALVRARARDPEVKRHAIWALGFSGDVESAELLIDLVGDAAAAKGAAEALAAITGLPLGGALAVVGKPTAPSASEVGDDDPPPAVLPEDALPAPNAAAVRAWWKESRARLKPGARYLYGRERTPAALSAALRDAPTWRREILWLELARTSSAAPPLVGWARDQLRQSPPAGSAAVAPEARLLRAVR